MTLVLNSSLCSYIDDFHFHALTMFKHFKFRTNKVNLLKISSLYIYCHILNSAFCPHSVLTCKGFL
jgi:hypothetical protein